MGGEPLQPLGILGSFVPFFPGAQYGHLLELFELGVGKPPQAQIFKIVRQHPADVRGEPVVRDDIRQQAAQGQRAQALDQKPLLMPGPAAALVEDGQVGRVEEQQVEGVGADLAVEEAAEAYPVEPGLGLIRPGTVQLHAVGEAVVPVRDLPQGLPAAAAGVQQIRGDPLRELDALQNQRDIVRVGGVVAQLDVVHQPPHHLGVGGSVHRELGGKAGQRIVHRAVDIAQQVKAQQAVLQQSRIGGKLVLLRLQQQKLGVAQGVGQPLPGALQLIVIVPSGGKVGIPVLLHPGPAQHHSPGELGDFALKSPQPLQGIAARFGLGCGVRLPAHGCSPPAGPPAGTAGRGSSSPPDPGG